MNIYLEICNLNGYKIYVGYWLIIYRMGYITGCDFLGIYHGKMINAVLMGFNGDLIVVNS